MKLNIFNSSQIKFREIKRDLEAFATEKYKQSRKVFSPASAYGQIMTMLNSFIQLIFVYLEDSVVESNIITANKQDSIFGWARTTGHNPTRAISAQGTLKIKIKPEAISEINASYITIPNQTKLICTNNSLPYFLNLGESDSLRLNTDDTKYVSVKSIQGEVETQSVLGTGEPLQSFNFVSKKPIDHEMVKVFVNGEPFENVESLYDMRKEDKSVLVKTGINGGIDIYFGNEDYGVNPPLGANITVEYVNSDGFSGNLFSRSNKILFEFDGEGYTNNGEEVDLNEILEVSIEKAFVLGSDAEAPKLTKLIAPNMSRSLVLANPSNYVHLLSRFNYSYVDAYNTHDDEFLDDDNVVYLFLIPDIAKRLSKNTDYYTTDLENFYLDPDEKDALYSYINQSGKTIITSEVEIIDPILVKYVMNVFLRIFDSYDPKEVENEVLSAITDYLLRVNRRDKIPKSDVIAIVESIPGVDSVNISFVSELNEKAIIDGFYIKTTQSIDQVRGIKTPIKTKVMLSEGEDPNLGLDDFGDIRIGLNEMPIFRGNWYDRAGTYYEDGISETDFSSVNIVVKETISENINTKIRERTKSNIKRS